MLARHVAVRARLLGCLRRARSVVRQRSAACCSSTRTLITRVFGVVTIVLGLSFIGRACRCCSATSACTGCRPSGWPRRRCSACSSGSAGRPCIGPTLGACSPSPPTRASPARGALLAFAYCLGLGIPFIVAGLAFRRAARRAGVRPQRHQVWVTRVGGAMLVAVGVLLLTGGWDLADRPPARAVPRQHDDGGVSPMAALRRRERADRGPRRPAAGPGSAAAARRVPALGVATADVDAHRPDAAVPARDRGGARARHPSVAGRPAGGLPATGCAPGAAPVVRPARPVPRLLLGVVRRGLRDAHGVAVRLHRAARRASTGAGLRARPPRAPRNLVRLRPTRR